MGKPPYEQAIKSKTFTGDSRIARKFGGGVMKHNKEFWLPIILTVLTGIALVVFGQISISAILICCVSIIYGICDFQKKDNIGHTVLKSTILSLVMVAIVVLLCRINPSIKAILLWPK